MDEKFRLDPVGAFFCSTQYKLGSLSDVWLVAELVQRIQKVSTDMSSTLVRIVIRLASCNTLEQLGISLSLSLDKYNLKTHIYIYLSMYRETLYIYMCVCIKFYRNCVYIELHRYII